VLGGGWKAGGEMGREMVGGGRDRTRKEEREKSDGEEGDEGRSRGDRGEREGGENEVIA